MSSGTVHRGFASAAIGAVLLKRDVDRGELTMKPVAGSLLAALATNLPDILEPATNPNHRQFFVSVVTGPLLLR